MTTHAPNPEAARRLHCGYDPSVCAGLVARVDVITFSVADGEARLADELIARSGGGSTSHTSTQSELAAALDAALERIVKDAATP